eukprot:6473363-Amphidinium_carterae.4
MYFDALQNGKGKDKAGKGKDKGKRRIGVTQQGGASLTAPVAGMDPVPQHNKNDKNTWLHMCRFEHGAHTLRARQSKGQAAFQASVARRIKKDPKG